MKNERIPISTIVELADSPTDLYSDYDYIVYIDESGNIAYDKTKDENGKGAEDYLNFGAAIIREKNRDSILDYITKVVPRTGQTAVNHMTDLTQHVKKVYLYKMFNRIPFTALGVVSYKKTLNNGTFEEYDPKEPWRFYHHNLLYLFELIDCWIYKERINPSKVLYIIEESKGLIIKALKNYVKTIQGKDKKILRIDSDNFLEISKNADKLTLLADAVAHALYHITSGQYVSSTKIVEPRYYEEIKEHFYTKIPKSSFGIKFVHKVGDVNLPTEISRLFLEETNDN